MSQLSQLPCKRYARFILKPAVIRCQNAISHYATRPLLAYFRVPADPERRYAWIQQLSAHIKNFSEDQLEDHSVICSAHFKADSYSETLTGRKTLRRDALPVILPGVKRKGWLARGVTLEPIGGKVKKGRKRKQALKSPFVDMTLNNVCLDRY